jgi:hypothetical protein
VNTIRRLREEQGVGLISALLLLAGVLLPVMFLVPAFARIEQGRLAAAQSARDAVRAAVDSPTPQLAQQAADDALARARTQTGVPLELRLDGSFARGGVLHAETSAAIDLASLPFVGNIGTVVVHGSATAPVDSYRSLLPSNSP